MHTTPSGGKTALPASTPGALGFATALAMLVAGCAGDQPARLLPAETAAALDARSLDDPRLREFLIAEQGKAAAPWDLAQLTLAGVYYHPDLDLARSQLAAAEAAEITAAQRQNPRLSLAAVLGTGAAAGSIPAGAAPLTIGPLIDLLIETANKRAYRTERAEHLTEAARAGIATASWHVRGQIRDALLDLWAANQRRALALRRLELQEDLTRLLEDRLAAGAVSVLDVERERIRRSELQLSVRDIARSLADARARLATAIGVPLAALDDVALSFDAFERPAVRRADLSNAALRRRALTERSDVKAALAQYEAAQSGLQLAIAGQYPNVALTPGYQYDFGVNKYQLSPSIDLPIFNSNEGPIAEAMAARQQAQDRFTALQAGIIGAIDRAATDYRTASGALAAAEALLVDSRRREQRTQRLFNAGSIDRLTLLAVQTESEAAEAQVLDARVSQLKALGAIEDALQYPQLEPASASVTSPEKNPRLEPDR